MNKKIKIKKFFDSEKEPLEYIGKYEENLIFFNELVEHGRKEDIEYVFPIKLYKYASSLIDCGKYKKALAITKELENDLEKLKGRSEWFKIYKEGVIFQKGVALGKMKRHIESNIEFKKLLFKNPKDDIYIEWYKGNKKAYISRLASIVAILGLVYYFLLKTSMNLGIESENIILKNIGLVAAILAYPITLIWRKIIDKKDLNIEK